MQREQRRLAAILAADVAGYSRLMAADESGTLARLTSLRSEIIEPKILRYHGRIVGSAGDSLLVEFASVLDAVQCAVEAQEALAGRNAALPEGHRMAFRMGVNLGDVIARDDTIHGDGVNIAARLEKLAEPGNVCIGRNVYDQVKGKLAYAYVDLGEQALHNIAEPIRAYRVDVVAGAAAPGDSAPKRGRGRDEISVAVLPFVNMSSDPEQDFFADGITEDIITDLSRWRSLAVTSRNSTFRFKGKAIDMQQVGRELGARFLVEGSVRRMSERVRITVQLIDAGTGNHVWAERFDRPVADLFAVQDEVVRTIVGTLVGRVYASGAEHVREKVPSSLDARDYVLRGNALSWDDPAGTIEAKSCFERAIEIDPAYGLPYGLLAILVSRDWANDLSQPSETLDRALALARRGVELSENESTCHTILGQIYLYRRAYDLALRHMERSIELNPTNQWNRADLGSLLAHVGRAEEGLELLRNSRRADPYFGPPWYWRALGFAQFVLRRYAEALADFDRAAATSPRWALAVMAGCCAKLGFADRARELVAQCMAGDPGYTVDKQLARTPFKLAADSEHFADCLRLAGIPG